MPAENVVPISGKVYYRRPLVTLVDSPAALRLLREQILTSKETYTALAKKAQLGNATVGRIASGETKLPRLETTIRLLSALGWQIVARRTAA